MSSRVVDEADLVIVERTSSSAAPCRSPGPCPFARAPVRPGSERPLLLLGVSAGRGEVIPIIGSRGKIRRAHGRHLWGAEVKRRSLRVLEAPLPPVDECREQCHDENDERYA